MKIKNKNQTIGKILLLAVLFLFSLQFVTATASFDISSFSCTPSEVTINEVFSCTAQIKNNGDDSGSVTTAALYTDANDWLEESYYTQSSGSSVEPGQSTEVTFSALRAIKSGDNGFSKIMLDDKEDTYASDNNVKVNVINVVVSVSDSASSVAMNGEFDSTAEVTAGGDIDVSITFTINSGGCSIGSQANPKSISGMSDGGKQSRTWTVTQSTLGDCDYTITAAATGTGGIASKSDYSSSVVSCTDCSTDDGNGDGGSSGGSSGAGSISSTNLYTLGEIISSKTVDLAKNEEANFNISNKEYRIKVKNFTETSATVVIDGKTFTLNVEQEINLDLDGDGSEDVSVKLKSINIIENKVKLIISPLAASIPIGGDESGGESKSTTQKIGEILTKSSTKIVLIILVVIFVVIAVVSAYYIIKKRKK